MNKKDTTKQYLPAYKKDFKRDSRWVEKESKHYTFYYFLNSVAESDIDEIVKIQENSFEKIISFLNIKKPKQKIKYYFYPDTETKTLLMGDDGYAQTIYKDFIIHVLYTEKYKPIGEHEDTHLLSLPLGLATGFFAEGLAECLSWKRTVLGKTKKEWLKEGLNKILSIEKIITHKGWMETPNDNFMYYYSFAGFFVQKLIKKYGINKFKLFFYSVNRAMTFTEINNLFIKYFENDIISFNK